MSVATERITALLHSCPRLERSVMKGSREQKRVGNERFPIDLIAKMRSYPLSLFCTRNQNGSLPTSTR